MSFFSIIGALGSVVSSVVSAVSSIGPAIAPFVSKVGSVIAAVVSKIQGVAPFISKFADTFFGILNILKPDEKVEDLGERALQASEKGITTDKFDNFGDYIDKLRNFDLDPDKAHQRSQAEKLVSGLGVATTAMEDKFKATPGSLADIWLLPIANPSYFTPERMSSIVSNGQALGDILAYLDKRLSAGDSGRLEKSLAAGAGDKQELYKALDQTRENWGVLKQKIEADKEA